MSCLLYAFVVIEFQALRLCGILHDLAILETALYTAIRERGPALAVSDDLLRSAVKDAHAAIAACSAQADMRPATQAAERLLKHLTNLPRPLTCAELETEARHLHQTIFAELRLEKAISVPRHLQSYINNDEPFGTAVRAAFPSASADLRDAGNALAVGLPTATVFHLMRAVEIALRALANERHVELPKGRPIEFAEWQELISAVRANVDATFGQWRRSDEKAAAVEFYGDLLGQFSGFKDAFRNHVMHSRASYPQPDAEMIFASVRAFYQRIAARMGEDGTPIEWKRPGN